MDPKGIKLDFKEIREAIKNEKNFAAIDKCQELLQTDPKNHMALVLLGAAYQSSDKVKTADYLRQALSCSQTPTFELEGVANCGSATELPEIYAKLLELVPEKSCEYHEKLSALGSMNSDTLEKCIKVLKNEALTAQTTSRKQSSQLHLGRVWALQDDVDDGDEELFKTCLEVVIADSTNPDLQLKCFKRYLELLYKLADIENLIKSADHMYNLFPDEIYSLEWICRTYFENYKRMPGVLEALPMPIDFYAGKLEELNPNSSFALLIRTIQALNDEQVYAETTALPNEAGNQNAQAPPGPSITVEGDNDASKTRQDREYFTGAQKRRIAALIRDGIEPEEARRRERARYALVQAERKAGIKATPQNKKRDRSSDDSATREEPKKHRSHTEVCNSPCANKWKDRHWCAAVANSNFAEESSGGSENTKKPTAVSAKEQPSVSGLSYSDVTAQCKVAIMHSLHPQQTLTEREIRLVRNSLLEEMDRTERNCPALKFVATSVRDGWLSIICHDTVTKNWLMSTVGRLKPWRDASLRITQGDEIPKSYLCVTYVPEADDLTKEAFLSRIAKQNADITTRGWRVLKITKEKSGGDHVTFAIDEASRDVILRHKCRIFLNFSQILVRIKGSSK